MIAYLNGTLLSRDGDEAVVVCGGVGYTLRLPGPVAEGLGPVGQTVALHVHTSVKEDAINLYGFASAQERSLFQLLLSVPNVGPKLALLLLSSLPPSALSKAVQHSDLAALTRVKGIGKKTAEPLLFHLKDKALQIAATAQGGEFHVAGHGERPAASADELVSALLALGYKPAQADLAAGRPASGFRRRSRPPVAGSASCSPSGVSCDRVPPCPRAPSSSPVPFSPAGARRKPPLRRPQASPRHRARRRRGPPRSPPSTSFSTAAITSSATSAPTGSSRTPSKLTDIPADSRRQVIVRDSVPQPRRAQERGLHLSGRSAREPPHGRVHDVGRQPLPVRRPGGRGAGYGRRRHDRRRRAARGDRLRHVLVRRLQGGPRPLHDAHIPFVEKDIEQEPAAAQELARKAKRAGLKLGGVPVIDVLGNLMMGYDPGAIDRAWAQARR